MKEKEIKVLKVEPCKKPELVTLTNTLEDLQVAVSIGADYTGLIEILDIDNKTCILCNEEGKLIGLQPNRVWGNDILCGVFYVCGQDRAGNLTSLKEDKVKQYTEMFAKYLYISPDDVGNTIFAKFFDLEDLLWYIS